MLVVLVLPTKTKIDSYLMEFKLSSKTSLVLFLLIDNISFTVKSEISTNLTFGFQNITVCTIFTRNNKKFIIK